MNPGARWPEDLPGAGDPKFRLKAPAPRWQALARVILVLGLVLLGAWTIQSFWPALAWAAVFGIALWPLSERMQQRWPAGRHNLLQPALFTAAIALIFILPAVLALFEAAREAHEIVR